MIEAAVELVDSAGDRVVTVHVHVVTSHPDSMFPA